MIQPATPQQTEPGQYIAPGLTTGVVAADLLTAWTVVAGRAIIANGTMNRAKIDTAAIGTAEIEDATITNLKVQKAGIDRLIVSDANISDLSASTITTGTLDADTITIAASGKLQNYNAYTVFNKDGLYMVDGGDSNADAINLYQKISNNSDTAAFAFFNDGSARGITMIGDGAGVTTGAVHLRATKNGYDTNPAFIHLSTEGVRGRVYVGKDLDVERSIYASNDVRAATGTVKGNNMVCDNRLESSDIFIGTTGYGTGGLKKIRIDDNGKLFVRSGAD